MNVESEFADFITETNKDGSNKARSYLLALKTINELLRGGYLPDVQIADIYRDANPTELAKLRQILLHERNKPDSPLSKAAPTPSHVHGGFGASAIRALLEFVENEQADADALKTCETTASPIKVAKTIAKTRVSQRTFRKLVLDNFGNACCLTGLDIRETLKAAIISPDERGTRNLQPDNALCLSATYAEAFSAHLITFDEKMRLVLSNSLRDRTSSSIFQDIFRKFEGTRMRPAHTFAPSPRYLEEHRELLVG